MGERSCCGVSLFLGHSPYTPEQWWQAQHGAQPGFGFLPGCLPLLQYFMQCRIDTDSRLEPEELAGKAGMWQYRDPLNPPGTNLCIGSLVVL